MHTIFLSMHTESTAQPSSAMGCYLFLIDTAAAERPLLAQASTKHRKDTSGDFRGWLGSYGTAGLKQVRKIIEWMERWMDESAEKPGDF